MAASTYHASHHSHRGPTIGTAPNIPAGTFHPGTTITVGAHLCTIERYLSEGMCGFAHVYLVKLTHPVHGSDVAVLKRVAVPDKEALASMRTEVDTMKRLKGHRHIVTYIDSHASHLKGGGYEVFLLMEFCSGGGLIDFMNTRLQHRLTEPEVLKIFSDVTQGVACMHYLQPPLLHRDLKVENVLIAPSGGYKVCDFGSCSPVKPAPQTVVECRLLEEDIQKHTTLQYRSPEMVDVFRRLPIDEKSDIWALGVLLYKLCYYTTPFEEQGQLAILNASFSFPPHPIFSDRLKNLIASMLREQPQHRPNIYQVVREVCYLRGREVPIKDIYTDRSTQSATQPEKQLPSLPVQSPPSVVAYQAPVHVEQQPIPDIIPMRRGRPTKSQPASSTPHSTATSRTRAGAPSPHVRPTTSDPFAALDKKPAQDELSNRFPSVEQFSLLHDSGNKFQFSDGMPPQPDHKKDFNEGLAERLAEDAFAKTSPPNPEIPSRLSGEFLIHHETISRGVTGSSNHARPVLYEPQPKRPVMVSTGTMTSPSPSPSPPRYENLPQIQALTTTPSSSTHDRTPETYVAATRHNTQQPQRPALLDVGRSATQVPLTRQPSSSRPSLEISGTLSQPDDVHQPMRSKSANSKPRPHSVYVESNLEFLRDLDSPSSQGTSTGGFPPIGGLRIQNSGQSIASVRSEHIDSNVDFLRAMEAEADAHKPDKRIVTGGFVGKHVKRASMPSISLPKAGTKNKLGGKFGDAFRRFERNAAGNVVEPARTPSPDTSHSLMPAISGSQGTSDGGDEWEVSSQEIPPEVKRELEKRQLSQEEKRVAAATAEYKRQLASRGEGETVRRNRANSIQKRVHALLNETKDPPPKTAEGYGRYTADAPQPNLNGSPRTVAKSETYRITQSSTNYRPNTATELPQAAQRIEVARPVTSGVTSKIIRKPVRSGNVPTPVPIITQTSVRPPPPPKPTKLRTGGSTAAPRRNPPEGAAEDWERSFAKRYPSLSGLEMVETVVGTGTGRKS
ncbi:hypothetical protein K440DRAFT_668446 [Wilcoxina mikolae CBS 423.85]|nr:hypothetical protein K440DRAFT_668446 [Wilcoxina mikolae CBS 423.85]